MSATSASIRYRPVRIGFLVEDGRIDDLITAAGLNTLLWGGIYNPLIPVSSPKLEFAEQLLDLFSVDVLSPVSETKVISDFEEKHKFLRSPHGLPVKEKIFRPNPHTEKKLVRFLDSRSIVNYRREKEAKLADSVGQCDFVLFRWDPQDALSAVFALQYGFFPTEYDLQNNFEEAFLNGLHSKKMTIAKNSAVDAKSVGTVDPISLTAELLSPYGGISIDGVFLGDENSFEDLVTFWNLRAAGAVLLFIPKAHLCRIQDVVAAHLRMLDRFPRHAFNYLNLYHRTATDDEITDFGKRFSTGKQLAKNRCTDLTWNGLSTIAPTFRFKQEQALASVERAHGRFTVYVQLPEMKFLADIDRESHKFELAAEILLHGEPWDSGHVLRVPRIRQLNEFYSRAIAFNPWSIRVQNEGTASIVDTKEKLLSLHPIPTLTLVRQIFKFADIDADISQPGRLAAKIIEKLGGIESSRVFKIRGVRELVQRLRPDQSVTRGGATGRIWAEGQFQEHEDLYIEPREADTKLTKESVFDFLLKHEFFRGGLELKCDDCRLNNWLPLSGIDDVWTCEYCGNKNLTSLHLQSRGDWKFRKSGLFAKDNNQEGAIPVLLTLLVFVRILGGAFPGGFAWTTALNLRPSDCETDFCVLSYHKNRVEIAIGECKSAGGQIDHKDLDNLKKMREELVAAGLDCYITLAKTADGFTEEETALLSEAAQEDIPLILFTNQEMEPYHPYWEDTSGSLDKYTSMLHGMAGNSRRRYLKRS